MEREIKFRKPFIYIKKKKKKKKKKRDQNFYYLFLHLPPC